MNVGVLRLGFAAFWLVVAGLLIFRAYSAPNDQLDRQGLLLGALLAVALAGWNGFRWYLARRARPAGTDNPLRRHRRRPLESRREERPAEYHPEFDFTRQDQPKADVGDNPEGRSSV